MYHLTQTQAMFIVAFFIIFFILKGAGNIFKEPSAEKLGKLYPEFKDALNFGYSLLYCKAMKKRGMVYMNYNWVPKDYKNDPNDPELRKIMKEKDLILNRDNKWVFTGKTKEYLKKFDAL